MTSTTVRLRFRVVACERREVLQSAHKRSDGEIVRHTKDLGYFLVLKADGCPPISVAIGDDSLGFAAGDHVELAMNRVILDDHRASQ